MLMLQSQYTHLRRSFQVSGVELVEEMEWDYLYSRQLGAQQLVTVAGGGRTVAMAGGSCCCWGGRVSEATDIRSSWEL